MHFSLRNHFHYVIWCFSFVDLECALRSLLLPPQSCGSSVFVSPYCVHCAPCPDWSYGFYTWLCPLTPYWKIGGTVSPWPSISPCRCEMFMTITTEIATSLPWVLCESEWVLYMNTLKHTGLCQYMVIWWICGWQLIKWGCSPFPLIDCENLFRRKLNWNYSGLC